MQAWKSSLLEAEVHAHELGADPERGVAPGRGRGSLLPFSQKGVTPFWAWGLLIGTFD